MPLTDWMLSPRRSRDFHQVKGAAQDSHRGCLQAVPEEGGSRIECPPSHPHPAGLAGSPAWSGVRGGAHRLVTPPPPPPPSPSTLPTANAMFRDGCSGQSPTTSGAAHDNLFFKRLAHNLILEGLCLVGLIVGGKCNSGLRDTAEPSFLITSTDNLKWRRRFTVGQRRRWCHGVKDDPA